jgi:hypothetical protein
MTAINLEKARECIRESIQLISQKKNEQIIRDSFTSYLRTIFPETPHWVERHIKSSEAVVKINKGTKVTSGFVDNLVDLTPIEYESDLTNRNKYDTGYGQVKDYCAALINEGKDPSLVIGVLSDTINWYAFKPIITRTDSAKITRDNVTLELVDSIDCSTGDDIAANRLCNFLINYLGRIGSRPITANSISADLGLRSTFCQKHIDSLESVIWKAFDSNPKYAEMITKLWCNFVTYLRDKGSSDRFELSFYKDELYILTLGKLICANFLSSTGLISDDDELKSILNGEHFSQFGPINFIEYDYFGWLNNTPYVESIIPIARDIQKDLQAYNYKDTLEEDLFGTLLAQLARRSQRLLLGQEWTPSWLAEKVVKEVIDNIPEDENLRLIDMCCGSGAMIVATVKAAQARIDIEHIPDKQSFDLLTEAITGFDIDPLAVMLSKINWLLASKDWLNKTGGQPFTIPIYHADSLFALTPISSISTENDEDDSFFLLQVEEHSIKLPKHIISAKYIRFFDALLDTAYSVVVDSPHDSKLDFSKEDSVQLVENTLNETNTDIDSEYIESVVEFTQQLISTIDILNRDGRNGIWVYIIRNSYRPGLVYGQFNGLVSNPPWLTLSKIANNPYQEVLKIKAEDYAIKPSGSSHLHIELATIFLLHSIDKYLRDNASVGCIIPETILNGHHQNSFRNEDYLTAKSPVPFKLNSIWSIATGTFKNNSVVLFGKKITHEHEDKETINGQDISQSSQNSLTWHVHKRGDRIAWSKNEVTNTETGFFTSELFRQGADVMPRTVFFFEIVATNDTNSPISHVIKSINKLDSSLAFLVKDAKKNKDFTITETTIPDTLVYDVFTSNLLTPFTLTNPVKAVLPIKRLDSTWQSMRNTEITLMGRNVRTLYRQVHSALGTRRVEDIFSILDTRNKLSQQVIPDNGYLVFTGAGGSNVCSAYLPISDIAVSKTIIDQTLYWAVVDTEDEAIYLTGLLNSDALNQSIKEFQPRGAFGERHIHKLPFEITPRYDALLASHQNIVNVTKQLLVELNQEIASNMELQKLLNPNYSTLSRRRSAISEIISKLDSYDSYNEACNSLYGV